MIDLRDFQRTVIRLINGRLAAEFHRPIGVVHPPKIVWVQSPYYWDWEAEGKRWTHPGPDGQVAFDALARVNALMLMDRWGQTKEQRERFGSACGAWEFDPWTEPEPLPDSPIGPCRHCLALHHRSEVDDFHYP